jgi:hypothetical protein
LPKLVLPSLKEKAGYPPEDRSLSSPGSVARHVSRLWGNVAGTVRPIPNLISFSASSPFFRPQLSLLSIAKFNRRYFQVPTGDTLHLRPCRPPPPYISSLPPLSSCCWRQFDLLALGDTGSQSASGADRDLLRGRRCFGRQTAEPRAVSDSARCCDPESRVPCGGLV